MAPNREPAVEKRREGYTNNNFRAVFTVASRHKPGVEISILLLGRPHVRVNSVNHPAK